MATTSTSTAIVRIQPVFTAAERLALAGFLAGYTGLTREACALDLRQYASWCQQRHLRLFQARRADIECFARLTHRHGRFQAPVPRPWIIGARAAVLRGGPVANSVRRCRSEWMSAGDERRAISFSYRK